MNQDRQIGLETAPREVCTAWLELYGKPTKRINAGAGNSYDLKHHVEHWQRSFTGRHRHIPAEAFTAAAIGLGYKVEPVGNADGDCFFNLAKPKLPTFL